MPHRIPRCFGNGPVCWDDCVISCAYWEECAEEGRRREKEEIEWEIRRPFAEHCDKCPHLERCGGCENWQNPCDTCPVEESNMEKEEKP